MRSTFSEFSDARTIRIPVNKLRLWCGSVLLAAVFLGIHSSHAAEASKPSESKSEAPPDHRMFDTGKTAFALITVSVCGAVLICTELARRGKPFYVRPIAGLQAIDEAVGRATEMGKPILYIPGLEDLIEIDTVAGLTILNNVAKVAAEVRGVETTFPRGYVHGRTGIF